MRPDSTFEGRQRWLFRVQRLPGESLSSVVERCALANAVGTRQFLLQLGLPAQGVDLDRLALSGVATCESALGYAPGAMDGTTLSSMVGQTFTRMTQQGLVEWCAGKGIRGKRSDAVCTACLADDDELYRRLHWRAAYVCRCDKHDRDLIDECPNCHGPVPTLVEMRMLAGSAKPGRSRRTLAWSCARCSFSWRPLEGAAGSLSTTASADAPSWRPYQAAILRAHHFASTGYAEEHAEHHDARDDAKHDAQHAEPPWAELNCSFTFQFLAGVRALLALLHSPTAGQRLRAVLAERIGCDPARLVAGGVRGQPVEVYPVANRRLALDAMASLLAGGIEGMLATMEEAKMTSCTLLLTERYIPNWLQAPIARALNGTRYSHSAAEIDAARAVVGRRLREAAGDPSFDAESKSPVVDVPEGALAPSDQLPRAASAASAALVGSTISKISVGRLLGSRDSKALDGEFGRVRRRYTREEAERFFAAALAAAPRVPVSRTQRQVVLRTILVLLGVAVRGQTVEEVCGWTSGDVCSMLRVAPREIQRGLVAALQASESGHAARLLTSRFGARLRGASTRLCAARLLSNHGTPGTWNSANALAAVLAPSTDLPEQICHAA